MPNIKYTMNVLISNDFLCTLLVNDTIPFGIRVYCPGILKDKYIDFLSSLLAGEGYKITWLNNQDAIDIT